MQTGSSHTKLWVIIGGIAFLIILFIFVDVDALIELLLDINWVDLLGATIVLLLGYLLLTVRLRYILFNQPGWGETFYANSIGYMLHIALFAPAMIVRAVSTGWITRVSTPQASSGILVERLLEQVMRLLAMALAISLYTAQQTRPDVTIGGSILLLLLMFSAIFWVMHHRDRVVDSLVPRLGSLKYFSEEQIRTTASSMLHGLEAVSSTSRLVTSLLMSWVAWTMFLIFQYLVLTALPLDLPASQMLLIAAAVLAVMPPSINVMLIIYQVAVTLLLVAFQLTDTTTAVTYAITLHLIQMICWIILGRWSLTQTDFKFKELVQAAKQYTGKSRSGSKAGTT